MQKPPQGASAAPPSWRAQPTTAARETLSRKKNPNPQKMCAPEMCAQKCARGKCAHKNVRAQKSAHKNVRAGNVRAEMCAQKCARRKCAHKNVRAQKPHNLRTIPWTAGNPGKTSQSEPHPSPHRRDPWKSWKKTSQYYGFACWLS